MYSLEYLALIDSIASRLAAPIAFRRGPLLDRHADGTLLVQGRTDIVAVYPLDEDKEEAASIWEGGDVKYWLLADGTRIFEGETAERALHVMTVKATAARMLAAAERSNNGFVEYGTTSEERSAIHALGGWTEFATPYSTRIYTMRGWKAFCEDRDAFLALQDAYIASLRARAST